MPINTLRGEPLGLGFHKALSHMPVDTRDGLASSSVQQLHGPEIFAPDALVALDERLGGG
jgi:hypothetical protein